MEKQHILEQRSLSGIYFRFKNPLTNSMENRTFEDLPIENQIKYTNDRDYIWLMSLITQLIECSSNIFNSYKSNPISDLESNFNSLLFNYNYLIENKDTLSLTIDQLKHHAKISASILRLIGDHFNIISS